MASRRQLHIALGTAGLALWWPLLRRPACFYVLSGHDSSLAISRAYYALYALCVIVGALIVLWRIRQMERTHAYAASEYPLGRLSCACKPAFALGLFLASLLAKIASLNLPVSGFWAVLLALADVTLYACCFLWLTCAWSWWVIALEEHEAAVICVISFVLSFFVRTLSALAPGFDAMAMAMVPALSALCFIGVGAPRCKGLVLSATPDNLQNAGMSQDAIPVSTSESKSFPGLSGLLSGITGLLALFLVITAVARAVAFGPLDGALLSPQISLQDIATMVLAAIVLGYYLLNGSSRRLLQFVWPLATIVLFVGLFLMISLGGTAMDAGKQIMVIGRTMLSLLLWLMLCNKVRGQAPSSFESCGACFALIDALSVLLGYVAVPAILSLTGIGEAQSTTLLASAVSFVLVIISILMFGHSLGSKEALLETAPLISDQSPQTEIPEAGLSFDSDLGSDVTTWLEMASLTERELEVAHLLAEGNSQKRIAELTGVSMGTVQTHIKSVYRKLGIHSKQELIDLAHEQSG